jgi:hypothetical protein
MTRFLVFTLIGAFNLAGGTGLAFGQNVHPKSHPTAQATKVHPQASGKRPPSSSSPQMKKALSQAQRPPAKRSKSPLRTQKGPAKPGKGPQRGTGGYSWDNYKRDMLKAGKEVLDGELKELPGELEIAGDAAAKDVPGAIGAAIKNAPDILSGKVEEIEGEQDAAVDTEKFIGARFNDFFKSKGAPAKPKNAAKKSNQRPAKPKSGTNR